MTVSRVSALHEVALAAGLDAFGVCTAAPFVEARAVIEERKAAGLHAGMKFTFRQPEYSTTPQMALREARSICVGALAYRRREPASAPPGTPHARVASYAWEEYYAPLKAALGVVSDHLRQAGWRTRVVVDDNALVDRAAAMRAGLGWAGKNANVLLPGQGSWFVLGACVTDAPLVAEDPAPVSDGCGSCRRCLDGCPTGAIVAPGVVDARRCLSWLLQAKGSFPREHRVALGDRIYGCDDCQEVCPPNRRHDRQGPPEASLRARAFVDVLALLRDPDEVLIERHGHWYIPDRDPRWLRRNALVVLANAPEVHATQGAGPVVCEARALLVRYLEHHDTMLVAHAVWAARRLGHEDLLRVVADHPDPQVRHELHAPFEP